VHVTLFWRKAQTAADGATSFGWARSPRRSATGGLYPVAQWQPGEIVRDDQLMPARDWRAGSYAVQVDGVSVTQIEVQ